MQQSVKERSNDVDVVYRPFHKRWDGQQYSNGLYARKSRIGQAVLKWLLLKYAASNYSGFTPCKQSFFVLLETDH